MSNELPEFCYAIHPTDEVGVIVKRDVRGYFPVDYSMSPNTVRKQNERMGVSVEQERAMLAGSMFGWECAGANPDTYKEVE